MNHSGKRLLKAFRNMDMFSRPVQLLIKREEGHKTIFGAALTIGLIVLFGILLYGHLESLYNRQNPSYLQTEVYHASPELYSLKPQNFTISFALQNPSYQTYIDDSIYVIEPKIVTKRSKMVDGVVKEEWTDIALPMTKCSNGAIKQESLSDYFSHIDQKTNYCINWNEVKNVDLEGTFDAKVYQFIHVAFKMCSSKTKGNVECKDRETIKKALEQNYFSMQLSSYTVDMKNAYTPHSPKGEDLFTTISSKIFKEIVVYMQPITTVTDYGIIQEDVKQERTIRYKRHTEMIDLNESDLIMNLAIRLDTIELINYRAYPKIQGILGELGGLWQVLFTLAMMFQFPINNLSYQISIINSLFNFRNQSESESNPPSSNLIQELENKNDEEAIQGQIPSSRTLRQRKNQNGHPNRSHAQDRLKSIFIKNQQLERLHQRDFKTKEDLSKAISASIKNYFRTVSQKLKLSWVEYLYFLKCFINQDNVKNQQIKFSVTKMEKQIDILYIIKKIQEIDKLKVLLLTQAQIKVFDYLPKPIIQDDPFQKQEDNQQYFSILKPEKSNYQRAYEAQQAFQEILKDPLNEVNRNLINCMDEGIINLLKLKMQQETESEPNSPGEEFLSPRSMQSYHMKLNKTVLNEH